MTSTRYTRQLVKVPLTTREELEAEIRRIDQRQDDLRRAMDILASECRQAGEDKLPMLRELADLRRRELEALGVAA